MERENFYIFNHLPFSFSPLLPFSSLPDPDGFDAGRSPFYFLDFSRAIANEGDVAEKFVFKETVCAGRVKPDVAGLENVPFDDNLSFTAAALTDVATGEFRGIFVRVRDDSWIRRRWRRDLLAVQNRLDRLLNNVK